MIANNQHAAGSSYKAPSSDDLGSDNPAGLPWGSVPLKGLFGEKSKDKKSVSSSRQTSTDSPSKSSTSSRG